MEPLTILEGLATFARGGRTLKSFAEGGEMHAVFAELAKVQGKAAARAIADRSRSQHPEVELTAAVTLLRTVYEEHKHNAERQTVIERVMRFFGYGLRVRVNAYFSAATAALGVVAVYALLNNRPQFDVWLARARFDFERYSELAEPVEPKPKEFYVPNPETGATNYWRDVIIYQEQLKKWEENRSAFERTYGEVSQLRF